MKQFSKRLGLVILAIIMTMTLTGCGGPEGTYKQAENLLAEGKYAEAAEKLESIGAYSDATTFAMYCRACAQAEAGEYEAAVTALTMLIPYRDSAMRVIYYGARACEAAAEEKDWAMMRQATALYDTVPLFLDSTQRSNTLKTIQYDAAVAAGESGDYASAFSLFQGLNGYNDSEKRILYYEARKQEDLLGAITTEQALLAAAERYALLEDYLDCADRAADLRQWADWSLGAYHTIDFDEDAGVAVIMQDNPNSIESFDKYVYGFIDLTGKLISLPQWDDYDGHDFGKATFSDGLCGVKKDGKWGFIDTTGAVVSPPQWGAIHNFHEGFAAVRNDQYGFGGNWLFIDTTGKQISSKRWDRADYFFDGIARVQKNDKYGYIDTTGKEVSKPQWEDADWFSDGYASVKKNGKWGVIDASGKVVIEPQWEVNHIWWSTANNGLIFDKDGLAEVWQNEKIGYIDRTGKVVIQPQWDEVESFYEGIARVKRNEMYGYVNQEGEVISQPQWEDAANFSEGYARVKKDGKYGFIDQNGEVIIEPQWDYAGDFSEGLARVRKDGKYGFIDQNGEVIIEPRWDDAEDFSEGVAVICEGNPYWGYFGLIDRTGKVIVEPQWNRIGTFNEGLAYIYNGEKYGFIDQTGEIIIEPQWDSILSVTYEGFVEVKKDGKWGYIDTTGKVVIEPQWDHVYENHFFFDNCTRVEKDGKYGLIDFTGEVITPPQWDYIESYLNGVAVVKKGDRYGLINSSGEIIYGFGVISR